MATFEIEDMPWRQLVSHASDLGVFEVGMSRAEAEQAVRNCKEFGPTPTPETPAPTTDKKVCPECGGTLEVDVHARYKSAPRFD